MLPTFTTEFPMTRPDAPSRRLARPRALPSLRPLAACLASALLLPGALAAATLARPGPRADLVVQNCNNAGPGSLRDAVAQATDGDVVDLTGVGCPSIVLTSGSIVIAADVGSLALLGPGQAALHIDGNHAGRVLEHRGSGTLTVSGLALVNGVSSDRGGCRLATGSRGLDGVIVANCAAGTPQASGASGGGAAVLGNAVLADAHFTGNAVDGTLRVRGGALSVGGTLSASDSTFSGNHATSHQAKGGDTLANIAEGGAIFALGATDLLDSTVSGNMAASDTYEVFGGGISVGSQPDDLAASLHVLRSNISGNTVISGCPVCAPQGGGVAVVGAALVQQTLLTGNSVGSAGQYGGAGGMRVFGAETAEFDDCTISGNHADSAGGGLIGPGQGVLAIRNSTIADNFAGNAGGTDEGGGGVLCFGCSVQVSGSTVSGNVAEANGGGIGLLFGEYAPSPMMIANSTLSGNSALEGGGVMIDGGNASVHNSTIAFNQASSRGAGISASYYSYQIDLQGTIVSNNTTAGAANNVWAFPDTVGGSHNLVPNAPGLPAQMPADTLTGDPQLLPLRFNGGSMRTHALPPGSLAIDAGANPDALPNDQRGQRYPRVFGAAADIGAFERSINASSPRLGNKASN
jgi:hypothetical protein